MTNLMYRIQLYMYSVLTAMWIFQYEPLMAANNVTTALSLQVLALVQVIVIGSIFFYSKLLKKKEWRNLVVRCTLVLRVILSVFLFVIEAPYIFVLSFMVYQLGAVGCDIFYESSVLEEANRKGLDFGKFRMFGSLGYATSGFIVSGILMLGFDVSTLMLLSAFVNMMLLLLNIKAPFSKSRSSQKISGTKVKIPLRATLIIFVCALITALPGSFGYLFNGYLREQFSLPLQQVTLYVSIAVFLGSCVSEVSAFYVVDSWIRKMGTKKILVIGFFASILRWSFALLSPNALTFIATYLFHGVNFAFLYVGVLDILKLNLSEKIMGTLTMRYMFIANLVGVGMAQIYASTLYYIGARGILLSYLLISIVSLCFLLIFYGKLIEKYKIS